MEEFGRVSVKGRIDASIEKIFWWVPEKGPINVSIEKWKNPCEYRKIVRMSTRKGSNEWEYRKMVEFMRVPGKAESVRVSKNCSGEYRKRVKSVLVPKNGRIRASTGKT